MLEKQLKYDIMPVEIFISKIKSEVVRPIVESKNNYYGGI